ncbi:hypothetical protein G6F65_010852 [Rhizopus arrhizus]|nr:hypothetical protein G6F65_010852 [Rhizopus arrhizus]
MARLYRSPCQRLLAACGGDDVVLVHVDPQAVLADVLGGDGGRADRVDQPGAALTRQPTQVFFVAWLAYRPAQLPGVAAARSLYFRAGGADTGRQQQGRGKGGNGETGDADSGHWNGSRWGMMAPP